MEELKITHEYTDYVSDRVDACEIIINALVMRKSAMEYDFSEKMKMLDGTIEEYRAECIGVVRFLEQLEILDNFKADQEIASIFVSFTSLQIKYTYKLIFGDK